MFTRISKILQSLLTKYLHLRSNNAWTIPIFHGTNQPNAQLNRNASSGGSAHIFVLSNVIMFTTIYKILQFLQKSFAVTIKWNFNDPHISGYEAVERAIKLERLIPRPRTHLHFSSVRWWTENASASITERERKREMAQAVLNTANRWILTFTRGHSDVYGRRVNCAFVN